MSEVELWHYTCQHGRDALGERGTVRTLADWSPGTVPALGVRAAIAELSWFTDLDAAVVEALGLTRRVYLTCDRTAYRYRVLDDSRIVPWLSCPWRRGWMLDLERARGVMPRHWYVATDPVEVVLA